VLGWIQVAGVWAAGWGNTCRGGARPGTELNNFKDSLEAKELPG